MFIKWCGISIFGNLERLTKFTIFEIVIIYYSICVMIFVGGISWKFA